MAMTGVLRPGHIQLKVLDLAESVDFYGNVLGLLETGAMTRAGSISRPGKSAITTACSCVRPTRRRDFFAFKVDSDATLPSRKRI
jgi:catechol 2,3-dioxygenase